MSLPCTVKKLTRHIHGIVKEKTEDKKNMTAFWVIKDSRLTNRRRIDISPTSSRSPLHRQWEFLSWMFVTNSKRVLLQTRFRRRGRLENAESFGFYADPSAWSYYYRAINRLSGSELNIKYIARSLVTCNFPLIARARPSSHITIVYNSNKVHIAIRAAHVVGYALVCQRLAVRGLTYN